jgi:hypothetical protein
MGKGAEQRFRDGGVQATRVSASLLMNMPVSSLWQAPPGHALHDPRSVYPVDEAMAEDMAERFRRGDRVLDHHILAREETLGRKKINHICNGSQRTNALRRAVALLRASGHLKTGDDLYVPVDLFTGDDAEFLEARIKANHDPWRKPDKPSILAVRARQLTTLGRTPSQISKFCPPGVGPAEVEALLRWPDLVPETKDLFDIGTFPIGLLAAVVDASRDEQVAMGHKLLAAGIKSTRGATRAKNRAEGRPKRWTPRRLVKAAALMAPEGAKVSRERELVALVLRQVAGEMVDLPEEIAKVMT